MYAIHFQFDEEINISHELSTEGNEGLLNINKTDFNIQYFKAIYSPDLEYNTITDSSLWKVKFEEVKNIEDNEAYQAMKGSSGSQKIYDIKPQLIGFTVSEHISLSSETKLNNYGGVPDPEGFAVGKYMF